MKIKTALGMSALLCAAALISAANTGVANVTGWNDETAVIPSGIETADSVVVERYELIGDVLSMNVGADGTVTGQTVDILNRPALNTVPASESSSDLSVTGEGFLTGDNVVVYEETPGEFKLSQNSPNPFNPATIIDFHVPAAGAVNLTVYNVMGQAVETLVDGSMTPGAHRVVFNGSAHAAGVYFYRLTAPGYSTTRKMLLIK